VYVDNDPLVLAHARALLASTPAGRTGYISADVTAPETILAAPELRDILDLTKPVALSLVALLHFVPDDRDPDSIVRTLVDALAPGSYVVLSQVTGDFAPEETGRVVDVYRARGIPFQTRSFDEFSRFFRGLTLIDPGVQVPHRWHPVDAPPPPPALDTEVSFYAGVAGKL